MNIPIPMPSVVMVVQFLILVVFHAKPCISSIQQTQISPGFQGSQMNFIDNSGLFLLSNDSNFAFGFINSSPQDTTSYVLAIVHQGSSSTVVWTANRGSPVTHSDNFVFGKDGNAYLQSGGKAIWSTNSSGKGVMSMELRNTGNLVVLGGGDSNSNPIWQSFSYPTDTLLSNQSFVEGMRLVSSPNGGNLSYSLEIGRSGDMMLYAGFQPPQPYWSMQQEKRKINNENGGRIYSAILESNSWAFYDQKHALLWQFIAQGDNADPSLIWAVVLGTDGFLSFSSLQNGGSIVASSTRIPAGTCDAPLACGPYLVCKIGGQCLCPGALSSSNCNPGVSASSCGSNEQFELVTVGDGIGYFATPFVSPYAKLNLTGCQAACTANCSCIGLVHDSKSGNCFMFDQIGSFQQLDSSSSTLSSYVKISSSSGNGQSPGQNGSGGGGNKHLTAVLVICFTTVAVISGLVYLAFRFRRRPKGSPEPPQPGSSEDDNFLDTISGMPVRFTYKELQDATDDFRVKLGQGGFGSVYLGKLPNGTQIAAKKLEGIGQGKKEFRAEVTTIGSIHHVHLVRLKGFCAESTHRLLVYEYMANGSLDRWIFQTGNEGSQLDWDQRFNIALGTAKGLVYLHEDCDAKIVHCDIKPENVLLDDNFLAKVSDFGLAKLMTREQSHVFTTLRGTRGYLAPEWITNYAISEKSDVYSFGMVLLEIIGGRKNFDPAETSEKAHFPSYAFKKLEEGKLMEIFDARLKCSDKDERVEIATKVALWCIQEDMSLRPSMAKVVQMLEGLSYVPQPPTSTQLGFRLYANLFKAISEEGSSSGPSDCNSDAFLSAVRLSGPR